MRGSTVLYFLSSLLALTLCLAPYQTGSQDTDWRAIFRLADSLQAERRFDEALSLWVQAEASSRNSPDSVREMLRFRVLYANGLIYNYEKEGIPFFEKAYPHLSKSGLDSSRQATFLNTYYHFLGYNGKWREALPIAAHCKLLRENTTEDPPLDYISVLHDLAYIHNKIGNYPQAIENYKISIELYIRYKGLVDHDVALGYNNLAFNYGQMGMANKEYEAYRQAAAIWEKAELKDRSYLGTVYGNLIRWQMEYGDVEEAGSLLARIRELESQKDKDWGSVNRLIENKRDDANLRLRMNLWNKSIRLYARKQEFDRAYAYLDSIRVLLSRVGIKLSDGHIEYLEGAYTDIGSEYSEIGKDSIAIRLFEKALALKRTHGYQNPMVHTHAKLAKSLMRTGSHSKAGEHIGLALEKTRSKADLPLFHILAAQIGEKNEAMPVVRRHISQMLAGLTGSEPLGETPLDIRPENFGGKVTRNYIASLSSAGHLYLGFYRSSSNPIDLKIARHLFGLASAMLGEYYLGGPYTETLADLLSAIDHGALQCQLLEPDLKQQTGELPELISSLEGRRSRHSWKKFLKNIPDGSLHVPDSLIAMQEEHQKMIVHYKSQLFQFEVDSTVNDPEKDRITAAIHRHQTELKRIEEDVLSTQPVYDQLSRGKINITELQKMLKGRSMLRYIMTDSAAYLLHVHPKKLQLYSLGPSLLISEKVEDAIRKLRDRSDDYYSAARLLYAVLLPEPVRDHLESQLVIVPEGILNYLPFEALSSSDDPEGFLLKTHTPSYATSIPLWLTQEKMSVRPGLTFAAFAPHYPSPMTRDGKRGENLPALPGAMREASVFSGLFKGDVHQGDSIIKSSFREKAPRYRLLHLAMHATMDELNGEQSHFVFPDSSRLYGYELYGMKLNADLAVLSACNTGQGPIRKGEGVQSLARAFTSAGVPSIVMGLWQLPDRTTSSIIAGFYRELHGNASKHIALATAKRDYLKQNESDTGLLHPYYWAGLVVSGNTGPLVEDSNRRLWIFLFFTLAAGGWCLVRIYLKSSNISSLKG